MRRQKGQAVVEFALVLPLFFLFFWGMCNGVSEGGAQSGAFDESLSMEGRQQFCHRGRR